MLNRKRGRTQNTNESSNYNEITKNESKKEENIIKPQKENQESKGEQQFKNRKESKEEFFKIEESKEIIEKKEPKNEPKQNMTQEIFELNEYNTIKLTIDKELQEFSTPESNLKKAEEIFQRFLKMENSSNNYSDKDKLELLKQVLDICEINPEYNYYYLKYYQKYCDNKEEYLEDKEILSWNLDNDKYSKLYNKNNNENIINDIFNLLDSCGDETKFQKLAEKIKYHNYNIPLIKSKEKFRLNLYRHRICKSDSIFRNKIPVFKELIKSMKEKYLKIDINENNINIEIYLFILCLLEVKTNKPKIWFEKFFQQIISPLGQINDIMKKDGAIIYLNNITDSKIFVEDINKDEFIIQNKFESIKFKGSNYVLSHLINEFSSNPYLPLNIILKRSESFSYFCQKKPQIIEDEEIFTEFKNYFILFIHSPLIKEVLKQNHEVIIELIESNAFPGLFFDSEYVKAVPLCDLLADGYTDKDLIVSFISYYPSVIEDFGIINTKEQYQNLKNVVYLFNIFYKFICSLHEILIHLCYGYLWYITGGKIENKSPKSSKKKSEEYDDGGIYFEELLLGDIKKINLQIISCLLNGEYLDKNLETFKNDIKLEFDPSKIKMGGLFGKILKKFKIDFSLFQYSKTIGHMRKKSNDFLKKTRCIVLSSSSKPEDFRKNRKK